MRIRNRLFHGWLAAVHATGGLPVMLVKPRWPGNLRVEAVALVPDDGAAHHQDRHRHEDHRLGNLSKRLRITTTTSDPRITAPVAPPMIHMMLLRNATIMGLFGCNEKTAR